MFNFDGLDLGPTIDVLQAFGRIARVCGDDYPELLAVPTLEGEDLDQAYVAKVREQARLALARTHEIVLERLVKGAPSEPNAPQRATFDEAEHPRDERGVFTDTGQGDAENAEWRDEWRRDNTKLAKREPRVSSLFDALHSAGGKDTMIGMNVAKDEPDLGLLVKRGESFVTKGRVFNEMEHNACHWNVVKLWREKKVDAIATGYALPSDGLWRQHSWGLKDGNVVETTARFDKYNGVKLTIPETRKFAIACDRSSNNPEKAMIVLTEWDSRRKPEWNDQ